MKRFFIVVSFAVLVFGFALFLWQKQVARYQFSLEKEKALFEGVGDVVKDFESTLEPLDEFMKNLEALQKLVPPRETATTTSQAPTSTLNGM